MKNMLIAGNWKMHTNTTEADKLAGDIAESAKSHKYKTGILLCPPFTSISAVYNAISGTAVMLGAQNCHYQSKGAFTGEISVPMLQHLNCTHIIIGHSERREIFRESDELINLKLNAIVEAGLTAVLCIGEKIEERKAGNTNAILEKQLNEALKNVSAKAASKIIIAYEPVWAIGTGLAATAEQVQQAHSFIRSELKKYFPEGYKEMLILYGGSVNPENAGTIFELEDVNGGLIGGASLKAESFMAIIQASEKCV